MLVRRTFTLLVTIATIVVAVIMATGTSGSQDGATTTTTTQAGTTVPAPTTTTTTTTGAEGGGDVTTGGDANADPATPPVLPLEQPLESWCDLVDKVHDLDADWYIEGVNLRAHKTGFDWDDVLGWTAYCDYEVRVIHAFGPLASAMTDTEIRDLAAEDIGDDAYRKVVVDGVEIFAIPIVRHPLDDNSLINTTSFGSGKMNDFVDRRDQVQVSLAPLRLDDEGKPELRRTDAGVFVLCGNLWWTLKVPPETTTTTTTVPTTTSSSTTTTSTTSTTSTTTTTTTTVPTTTTLPVTPDVGASLVCVEPLGEIAYYRLVVTVTQSAPGLTLNYTEGVHVYFTSEFGTVGMTVNVWYQWTNGGPLKITRSVEGPCGKSDPEVVVVTTTLP